MALDPQAPLRDMEGGIRARAVPSTFHGPAKSAFVLKRTLDIGGALFLAVLSAPLVAGIPCALAAHLRGNPFLAQLRTGYRGKAFTLYKLRTMVSGAHELRPRLLRAADCSPKPFKLENDPRVTRMGSFLRRWSLD